MSVGASFSPCGTWRYMLTRGAFVGWPGTRLVVVGLNPSTADERNDDPTVRRCVGFARDLMYEWLVVVNLFAYRATDPRELRRVPLERAIGPDTDECLLEAATREKSVVVCAWGVGGKLGGRGEAVRVMLEEAGVRLNAFGLTKGGHPRHPLYLPGDSEPVPWLMESGRCT